MPTGPKGDKCPAPNIEILKDELADKKAMLAVIESGEVPLGGPFENREAGLRNRIAALETQIGNCNADRP